MTNKEDKKISEAWEKRLKEKEKPEKEDSLCIRCRRHPRMDEFFCIQCIREQFGR